MQTLTALSPDKAVGRDPAYCAEEPNSAIVFFVIEDATTLVCAVFVGAAQAATSRAFALQWLAAHYGIPCSGDETRDWARVLDRYEADGALYYTLETVVPRT
jgi:hypothetical protein